MFVYRILLLHCENVFVECDDVTPYSLGQKREYFDLRILCLCTIIIAEREKCRTTRGWISTTRALYLQYPTMLHRDDLTSQVLFDYTNSDEFTTLTHYCFVRSCYSRLFKHYNRVQMDLERSPRLVIQYYIFIYLTVMKILDIPRK